MKTIDYERIDKNDRRPAFRQIANSIRAHILVGRLSPGQRLEPGRVLSEYFEVSPMTVHQAIRLLREEGFVTSRAGSGVTVSKQPGAPDSESRENPLSGLADFLHEMGQLKRLDRAGWHFAGVPNPETVAEHSFRAAIVGIALASLEGADVARTAALCLLHDSPESRTGDIPAVGRAYVTTDSPEAISVHQTSGMPPEVAAVFRELVRAFEAEESIEVQLAHDADRIETLLQAREYAAHGGHDTANWQDSASAVLKTRAGNQLVAAILATTPTTWWQAFSKSYPVLRKHARTAARSASSRASETS